MLIGNETLPSFVVAVLVWIVAIAPTLFEFQSLLSNECLDRHTGGGGLSGGLLIPLTFVVLISTDTKPGTGSTNSLLALTGSELTWMRSLLGLSDPNCSQGTV